MRTGWVLRRMQIGMPRTSEPFLIIYEANEMDLKSPIADAARRRAQSEALDNRRSWFSLIIWIVLRRW